MSLKSLDRNNFDQEVSQGLVLVDFWATWCAPCNALTPVLEKIADDSSLNVRVAKVDVDANRELMMRFNVRSIPTMIYFKDGRAKLELGLARRKRKADRRQDIAKRDADLEARRAIAHGARYAGSHPPD